MLAHLSSAATVLIVDDNPGDVSLAREVFDEAHMTAVVESAADGVEAVALLQAMALGSSPIPSLVLLDINMPRMNGFEVLAFMKRQPRLVGVPVFMLSSSRRPVDSAHAQQLGADGYLVKPESFDGYLQLAASLAKYLTPPG